MGDFTGQGAINSEVLCGQLGSVCLVKETQNVSIVFIEVKIFICTEEKTTCGSNKNRMFLAFGREKIDDFICTEEKPRKCFSFGNWSGNKLCIFPSRMVYMIVLI